MNSPKVKQYAKDAETKQRKQITIQNYVFIVKNANLKMNFDIQKELYANNAQLKFMSVLK